MEEAALALLHEAGAASLEVWHGTPETAPDVPELGPFRLAPVEGNQDAL
jgi:hypothetical protein